MGMKWNYTTMQMSSCSNSNEFLGITGRMGVLRGIIEVDGSSTWRKKGSPSFARGGIIPHPDKRSVQEGEDHGSTLHHGFLFR